MGLAHALNTGWMLLCRREGNAFRDAQHDVAGAQSRVLRRILAANAQCAFGRRHGFERIRDAVAYQRRVPLSDPDSLAASIDRIANGASGELTVEPVLRFEQTSGSTGGRKLIPYTDALHREFQRAISAWIWDLFSNRPAVRKGRAYWSVSPAMPREDRAGAVPIGLDDDTAYLGGLQRRMARHVLAVSPTISKVQPLEAFRYATLLSLLAAEDLALISVWSPTFLTTLLAGLEAWQERVVNDLGRGTLSAPVEPGLARFLPRVRASAARAEELQALLTGGGSRAEQLALIWPRLALISCWTDASAAAYVPQLRALFPRVELQPKGLLATEGVVSVPRTGHEGSALAIRSHFLEFEDAASSAAAGRPRLAHELERGGRYRVLLTTGGGLYRYPLHDEVEVVGFTGACPLVRFLGRTHATSDLVGEKLHERHVGDAVARVLQRLDLPAVFHLLAPVAGTPPRYRLFLQLRAAASAEPEDRVAQALEEALFENPHYAYAVNLGQLGPVEVTILPVGPRCAFEVYEQRCAEQGQRVGDIKPVSLDARLGWEKVFAAWARRPMQVSGR